MKAKRIVVYPYAHLSSTLASPDLAEKFLKDAESSLKHDFEVARAPFGWYKAFTLASKGHPLSELSREFSAGEKQEEVKATEREKPFNREHVLQQMSRVKMSAERAPGDLKSNVELGKELDLYLVSEVVGGGLPLLTPRGTTIKRELERFIVDKELAEGYSHTSTPIMAKSDLYKISGHWDHYKDNMFSLKVGQETFALRPMTCPFHFAIYKSKSHSYRELPLKYAEIASLFRNEKSGELMGLTRIRQFTLADAHILCRPDQLEAEFSKVVNLIQFVTKTLGMNDLWFRFSKWDPANKEKYIDNPQAWKETQQSMKKILDKLKLKYVEAANEAAFYGPKLDIQYKNVFGKEDTLLTVQIDFAAADRFDLTYVDEAGTQQRPMLIHRSSVGCFERTIAHLLEKTQGKLPLWLSPVQVKIVTVNDSHANYAHQIATLMKGAGLRVDVDDRVESIGKKVRDAQVEKVNYIVTVGDKELAGKKLAVRSRAGDVRFDMAIDGFVAELVKERDERRN